jgi:hypothetical protein
MALDIVQDYLSYARELLQDTIDSPYRYPNADLLMAMNLGILEMRRIRPDLLRSYLNTSLPSYSSGALSASVALDAQFRPALLYYIVGHAQLRDDESQQDARATVFLNKFVAQLTTIAA